MTDNDENENPIPRWMAWATRALLGVCIFLSLLTIAAQCAHHGAK